MWLWPGLHCKVHTRRVGFALKILCDLAKLHGGWIEFQSDTLGNCRPLGHRLICCVIKKVHHYHVFMSRVLAHINRLWSNPVAG